MIQLAGLKPFASGDNRLCFVHPDDPSRCLKLNRPDNTPEMRRRGKHGWHHTLAYYDENLRDSRVLTVLEKVYDNGPFPKFYGWLETDFGPGLVVDLVRDENGEISKTLQQYLFRSPRMSDVRAALMSLADFFKRNGCVIRGMQPHNMLVRDNADGLRLIVIDNLQLHMPSMLSRAVAKRHACHVMLDLQRQLEILRDTTPRLSARADLPIPFIEDSP